jgi:hypothetical protein
MQLRREVRDQLQPERAAGREVEARRQANAVVADHQRGAAVIGAQLDPDAAGPALGERVLERVRHQLVDDEAAGHRAAHVEVDLAH